MKRANNFFKIALLTGALALANYSCEKSEDDPVQENPTGYVFPSFKNPTETLIKGNLESPAGLSYSPVAVKSGEIKGLTEVNAGLFGLFAEGPIYRNLYSLGGLQAIKNPKISQLLGNLTDATATSSVVLTEFDLTKYSADFDALYYRSKEDSLFKPNGLTLDNLILDDGTILSSSNSSNKIFKKSLIGGIEVYLEDAQLERITDMIQARDRKIYAAQAPLIDKTTHAVISPKKIISINNKTIKKEFELPYDINSLKLVNVAAHPTFWEEAPFLEKIRIVENSEAGKKNFGYDFYVSDLLKDAIYGITKNTVKVIAENLRYPSSIAVDSAGTVFYTSSPLDLDLTGQIDYPAALNALNPATKESKKICEFGGNNVSDYFDTEKSFGVRYPNIGVCSLPVAFNVTNILFETKDNLYFLISNSHQGTLKLITLDK